MKRYYEHHIDIRKNKLCPFIFRYSENVFSAPCNWHQNIELLFVTEGSGRMQYDAEEISMSPDDLFVINVGAIHRPYSVSGISFYYLIIDESFCGENGIDTSTLRFTKKVNDSEAKNAYLNVISCMRRYHEDGDPLSVPTLRNAVLSLLLHLCEKHAHAATVAKDKGGASEEYVKHVLDYINDHFQKPIGLNDLAVLCGITKFHLSREFKRYTGQTVFTYLNTLRCKHAERCIADGMSVTAAAYESGFESLSYFSRTYKRLMGTAPSRTRQ